MFQPPPPPPPPPPSTPYLHSMAWLRSWRRKYGRFVWLRAVLPFAVCFAVVFILRVYFLRKPNVRMMRFDQGDSALTQDVLDYFARSLDVRFRVIENSPKIGGRAEHLVEAEVTITNTGYQLFPGTGWEIFFAQIFSIHLDRSPGPPKNQKIKTGLQVSHWGGSLYGIRPMENFDGIEAGETVGIRIYSTCCNIAYSDVLPNWYITAPGLMPRTIERTIDDPKRFVVPYNSPKMWKRQPDKLSSGFDHNNPPSAEDRYIKDGVEDLKSAPLPVIPSPLIMSLYDPKITVNVLRNNWIIVTVPQFDRECEILSDMWNLEKATSARANYYIKFVMEEVQVKLQGEFLPTDESYSLSVTPDTQSITIKASKPAGAFYAVQTLLSLADGDGNIPATTIMDAPRYKYRGVMIDVARNFHKKETIYRVIKVMSMYKLNKLHLHLTDDEGWRLEIPGLEELTQVGATRCHDPTETKCLLPFLGSGPEPYSHGTGYYTVEDYKNILSFAAEHHVEVIPEFDMPGHSHAAVKAMKARYNRLIDNDIKEAEKYLLTDLKDETKYRSLQEYTDNVVNICMLSTFTFVRKVLDAVYNMHANSNNPLRVFHFGADEVPKKAWQNSPQCKAMLPKEGINQTLKETFLASIVEIANKYSLDLASWEDGMLNNHQPVEREKLGPRNVFTYVWNNVCSDGCTSRAYNLANSGYKVILSPATLLYFDHPYEPEPEEPGLIWATRYISTKKVFQMIPENIYWSSDAGLNGIPAAYCTDKMKCPDLEKKDNIAGIQGTLFGELVRNEKIMDYMLLPRMLALAERAWHAASWEYESDKQIMERQREQDWVRFANTLGHKELARLDKLQYNYRIPPPGAMETSGTVKTSVTFPGLEVEMSTDSGETWTQTQSRVWRSQDVLLRTKSVKGKRYSRTIHLFKRAAEYEADPSL